MCTTPKAAHFGATRQAFVRECEFDDGIPELVVDDEDEPPPLFDICSVPDESCGVSKEHTSEVPSNSDEGDTHQEPVAKEVVLPRAVAVHPSAADGNVPQAIPIAAPVAEAHPMLRSAVQAYPTAQKQPQCTSQQVAVPQAQQARMVMQCCVMPAPYAIPRVMPAQKPMVLQAVPQTVPTMPMGCLPLTAAVVHRH
eukprot:TRINITY_DN1094_c4_g1_i1.p1 TRINITY_DN1094_c4_g1~~TRINITY_DN1094_c4_g1_i1.p1  ORF type:complete len:196 (+),score=52.84 TRINITY_DN1094_c4_g1_i1:220-807(+)